MKALIFPLFFEGLLLFRIALILRMHILTNYRITYYQIHVSPIQMSTAPSIAEGTPSMEMRSLQDAKPFLDSSVLNQIGRGDFSSASEYCTGKGSIQSIKRRETFLQHYMDSNVRMLTGTTFTILVGDFHQGLLTSNFNH